MNDPANPPPKPPATHPDALDRAVGVGGAVMMGIGSIVGTGVFVSLGIAAGVAGPACLLALLLAALLAACNGLSSAQLAASHPVSGGTYEYGYKYANPALGFTAGWMFLCAKSASAATAALGFAGYLLHTFGEARHEWRIALALAGVAAITAVILTGIRRSNHANIFIVTVTLLALGAFVAVGAWKLVATGNAHLTPFFAVPGTEIGNGSGNEIGATMAAILHATALLFVAYTGYGRIATLGEEVRDPVHTIPRAIVAGLVAVLILYAAVGFVAVASVGASEFGDLTRTTAAPLEAIARTFDVPAIPEILALGAITAMLGVLLNLILGLSRVMLAMGRRRDLPAITAHVSPRTKTPTVAVILTAAIIGGLVLIGDVKTTWSFSAFTVLIYYAITNFSALRLPAESRRFPRIVPVCGLMGCLGLAWFVEHEIWILGLVLILGGLIWHAGRRLFVGHGGGHGAGHGDSERPS